MFALLGLALAGCTGSVLPGDGFGQGSPVELDPEAEVAVSGLRRLSRFELDTTISDLLLENSTQAQALLAADPTNPYDNDYRSQVASATLIEAIERIATDTATRLTTDAARQQQLLGCVPAGASDTACLRTFISTFGRRALRRPLSDEEVDRFAQLQAFATESNDFTVAVKLVVQAMLQHPEFLYRVELGTPVPGRAGTYQLTQFELASRLSYFLWGTTPPDWLLDLAQANQLRSTEQVRLAASRLMSDPKAVARVERFHALWFGYHRLPHAADLGNAMITESSALVDRVVFEQKGDWFDLFRSTDTYVNATLATQYGMSNGPQSGWAWVPYGSLPRKGLLGHGSVLSQGTRFSDSSPTQRGIYIRNRLFCQEIPPPPVGVNVDQPPESTTSNCKKDRYAAHASVGGCKSCHMQVDPVGFGLENFDREGKYRAHDEGETNCTIDGQGELTGLPQGDVTFQGQVGLSELMLTSGQLESCAVTQVFRFAAGRREDTVDAALLGDLARRFTASNHNFSELMLDFVSADTFAFRKDE